MEMVTSIFLRILFSLLLLCGAGAGASAVQAKCSTACKSWRGLVVSESKKGIWFLVEGKPVPVALFCRVVGFCVEKGCDLGGLGYDREGRRISEEYCLGTRLVSAPDDGNSGAAAGKYDRISGRKILHRILVNSSSSLLGGVARQEETQINAHFTLSSEKMAIIAPPTFLLCCAFLCPCIYAKRKDTQHKTTLSIEVKKVDSVSSPRDMINLPERSLETQVRTPSSPILVPTTPFRGPASMPRLTRFGLIHLSLNEITRATQGFSPSNMIGGGGFGTVYKAHLPDGQVVAIKRAKREQAADLKSEFSNEVELLSKIEHRNLVRLLGYTEKGNEKVIITEYVPNGNLREHLDGQHGNILDFNQRLEIAIDVAHALTYLHSYAEKQVIHRDVKSSNILLTEGFRAKVADFGFARIGPANEDQTHISTEVKGTAGYLDPEYLKTYQLTPKSDVFSFGILLLEILSGRRPVEMRRPNEERITVTWAFKNFEEGNMMDILDPELGEVIDENILSNLLDLAFQCSAPIRVDRPVMKEVVEKLWEIRKDYQRSRRSL